MKFTVASAALLTEAAAASASHGGNILHGQSPLSQHATARKLRDMSALSSKDKSKRELATNIGTTLLNKKRESGAAAAATGPFASSRGQKLQEWVVKGRVRQLINLVRQEDHLQECDPYDNADVGILSCGQGRYCLESSWVSQHMSLDDESVMGGVCIDMPSQGTVDHLNSIAAYNDSRHLQAVNSTEPITEDGPTGGNITETSTSIIAVMNDICYGNLTSPEIACDCQGVDAVAYTGSVTCQYQEICGDLDDVCGDGVTFCYATAYSIDITAPYTGVLSSQYDFTVPTVLKYQYSVTYAGQPDPAGCTIAVDDTQCNSCAFTEVLDDGDQTPTYCLAFDCSNTNLELSATLCDGTSVVNLLIGDELLYGSLPCANGCNACGEGGYMTLRDNNVTMPTGEIYPCRLVDTAALAGYFYGEVPDLCAILPTVVESPCGCEGGTIIAVDNVTDVPGSETTSTPTASTGTVPTAGSPVSVPTLPPAVAPTDSDASLSGAATVGSTTFGTVMVAVTGWLVQQVMTV